jgi:Sec-independent protein translocase protein TatA
MNILDDYIKWNQKVFIGVSFFIGIFGIDLLGLVLQPKFLIIFIKNFFGELKSNPAAKALSNTIKEYKQDDDKAKEKEEKDKRRQERQQQKQEQEVQENTSDSKPPEARSISPPSHVDSGRFGKKRPSIEVGPKVIDDGRR